MGFIGAKGDDAGSTGDTGVLFFVEDGGFGIVGRRLCD